MILYLDTSALVKLYVDEEHSQDVRLGLDSAQVVITHLITYAEARAAFARKAQEPAYRGDLAHWCAELEIDWSRLHLVQVDEPLVRRAGDLAQAHGLRGYDSVHLAAMERIGGITADGDFRVAVFDRQLAAAVSALGIRLLV